MALKDILKGLNAFINEINETSKEDKYPSYLDDYEKKLIDEEEYEDYNFEEEDLDEDDYYYDDDLGNDEDE